MSGSLFFIVYLYYSIKPLTCIWFSRRRPDFSTLLFWFIIFFIFHSLAFTSSFSNTHHYVFTSSHYLISFLFFRDSLLAVSLHLIVLFFRLLCVWLFYSVLLLNMSVFLHLFTKISLLFTSKRFIPFTSFSMQLNFCLIDLQSKNC